MSVWAGILLITLVLGVIGLVRIISFAPTARTRGIWSVLWLLLTAATGCVVYFSGIAFLVQSYAPTFAFVVEIQYWIYAIFSAYALAFTFVFVKTKKRNATIAQR